LTEHFLHVGKTGGTAVKHALQPIAARFGIVLHPHPTTLPEVPAGEFFFFFLRDPAARFATPEDPVEAHRMPAGPRQELGAEAVANLRRWYAADFAFYDFCRQLRRTLRWD
jgi:hypothetical protein